MSDRERGRVLVGIARESIEEALGLRAAAAWDHPWLFEPGACFITLMRRGALRGCVGSVRAYRPLYEDVRSNARASAFEDTRFPPVECAECPELQVEVSLLSTPEPVVFSGEAEALAVLRPEIDGIIFESGGHRSTFLPQVWGQLPDPRDFLGQLKLKAGLSRSFWSPDVRLWRYTVTKWVEGE
jgi:AmmeMemoRadiSam system protein A